MTIEIETIYQDRDETKADIIKHVVDQLGEKTKQDQCDQPLWVLGYGSLIFKPPPHAKYRIKGYIHGFIRRFWQSSSDHRGTPESPGRVVTLVTLEDVVKNSRFHSDALEYELSSKSIHEASEKDLKIWGCIYYIPAEFAREVGDYLDVREQDGYSIHTVNFNMVLSEDQSGDVELLDAIAHLDKNAIGHPMINSMVYIGTVSNESFVGPEDLQETASIIASSVGPSGPNIEYLLELEASLDDFKQQDRYIKELSQRVRAILDSEPRV
ncbi:unnamed protein product [Kuraishia capsulata CBS 1993]|uniref:glutathione-specific gamma-glutamylcyclotransferase n=1 Tax=Kuraishia capsulata CBS 1993 TaxID=1382522 RepID=W6MQJ4_9ASCO|nr:uncharacterized protein KUCA_T00000125001 [Kuraishia capsulata CBS 1993]CDK24165.1 unnamed protein product [Kuraishia capsulata CBS 1993]